MYRSQSGLCYLILLRSSVFQVFQLTTLVIRGSPTQGEEFTISLDRVAIKKEEVRGVLLFLQDFFWSPHFTQRNFSRRQAGLCWLNLLLSLIALRQVLFMPHGQLLNLPPRAKSLVICAPIGIGWCCVVALLRTLVSAGIMVAPRGVKERQGQG